MSSNSERGISYNTSVVAGRFQVHSGTGMCMLGKRTWDCKCQQHSKQLLQHQEFHMLILNHLQLDS